MPAPPGVGFKIHLKALLQHAAALALGLCCCGRGFGRAAAAQGVRMPAATGVRALAVDWAHLVDWATASAFLISQTLLGLLARTENRGPVVICIHMADCTFVTRLSVVVVMGAAGRSWVDLASAWPLLAASMAVLGSRFRPNRKGGIFQERRASVVFQL